MYPRNAASPPRIAIGAVVQISDGAVQTSGCTVRVIEQGGAEGDGAGTTAYSTDGVVLYTPTQAETDQSAFVLIAKKTGCIPAAITVVTTASATAGYAGLDWSAINAPTTTVGLTGTTISTSQAVASVSGAVGSVSSGGITAASIATNAIDADSLATDAVTEIVSAVLTTAMTESYNTDGAAPTLTQALLLVLQILSESSVSGTTLTVKKLDGSTTAATFTLNSSTAPTSITRAS